MGESAPNTTRKRMNGDEREALLRIMTVVDIMHKQKEFLASRLDLVPNGARMYGHLETMSLLMFEHLMATIPSEQLQTFRRNLPYMAYTVGTKRVANGQRDEEYGMWISFEALKPISEAIHEHCMMCGLNAQEQRSCQLAKALDTLPSDKDDSAPGCGYFGIV
jgi:hypothetical protein